MLETYNSLRKLAKESSSLRELTDDDIKHVQEILLDMMEDIHTVCEKYHLSYAISGGAMLGAVRHKGFVPWDDDIDICMPRKDYNRLPRLMLKEFGDKYWVQDVRLDSKYDLNFMKIRKKNTTFLEIFDMDPVKAGIFIDIFAAENTFSSPFVRKLQGAVTDGLLLICSCVRMASKQKRLISYTSGSDVEKAVRLKCVLGRILGVISLRRWLLLTDSFMSICRNSKSEYISIPCGRKHFFGETYKRSWFYPASLREFNGHSFYCVADADGYLKNMYGDYMTVPPESERERHSVVSLSFDKGLD